MKTFNKKGAYETTRTGDSKQVVKVNVTKRTKGTIWFIDEFDNTKRAKIHSHNGSEFFYPEGRFSLCPVIMADSLTHDLGHI